MDLWNLHVSLHTISPILGWSSFEKPIPTLRPFREQEDSREMSRLCYFGKGRTAE